MAWIKIFFKQDKMNPTEKKIEENWKIMYVCIDITITILAKSVYFVRCEFTIEPKP